MYYVHTVTIILFYFFPDAFSEILVENSGAENTRAKKTQETQEGKNSNQKEIFIKKGSQLKLKCEMKKATEKPNFIFW